jgi:hypothetical protein
MGKVEIERMKESHFDGTRSGRNFALDIQAEPEVMESEISGLPDLCGKRRFFLSQTRKIITSVAFMRAAAVCPRFSCISLAERAVMIDVIC